MKYLTIILTGLALASCATTKAPSTPPLPQAPPRAVLVAPEASRVRESIATADRTAAVIDAGAKDASKAATAARQEAERLKDQAAVSPAEMTKLWQDLQSLEARNLFLETQASRLVANLTDARNTAATLQQVAAEKDAEAEQLRAQHLQLSQTATHYSQQLDATHQESVKQRTRADKLAGEILLYRIALVVLTAIGALYIFARIYFRPRLI